MSDKKLSIDVAFVGQRLLHSIRTDFNVPRRVHQHKYYIMPVSSDQFTLGDNQQ